MNEVKELKTDSTLWAKPAKLVNLLDFKPEKLSIKTENDKLSMIITHIMIIGSVYRDYYDRFYPQIHLENIRIR